MPGTQLEGGAVRHSQALELLAETSRLLASDHITLPRVPGGRLDGAYRPASAEAELGGDWYDAFELPDHRVAISMGDVPGDMRIALRAAAVGKRSPAAVLEQINGVTAIFAYYEPSSRELTYAVAGQRPPALIVEDGFAGCLPGGGIPHDWLITLPPRSWVVFYTEGRTLTLSCFDGPLPERMVFSAIPMAAPIVRAMVHRFCDQQAVSDDQRFALTAAIGEAIANAVEHAYPREETGRFELRLSAEGDCITVDVQDQGQWRPFDRRDDRGRGMLLMRELMDRVRITSAQHGTCLSMVMNLRKTA